MTTTLFKVTFFKKYVLSFDKIEETYTDPTLFRKAIVKALGKSK